MRWVISSCPRHSLTDTQNNGLTINNTFHLIFFKTVFCFHYLYTKIIYHCKKNVTRHLTCMMCSIMLKTHTFATFCSIKARPKQRCLFISLAGGKECYCNCVWPVSRLLLTLKSLWLPVCKHQKTEPMKSLLFGKLRDYLVQKDFRR